MLQFCGKESKIPYHIQAIDKDVYSLEEINYFLYNHMNMVYRDFFCEPLFEYIETQLERADIANGLGQLEKNGASCAELVKYIFKETGYLSPNQLSKISILVESIDDLTKSQRMSMEADKYFEEGRMEAAISLYLKILKDADAEGLSAKLKARAAFAAGCAYARLFMSKNANAYFQAAYDFYPDASYAKASVYMSVINKDDEELLKAIIKYKISDEALGAIRGKVSETARQIENESGYAELNRRLDAGDYEGVLSEWKNKYYLMKS